MPFYAPYLPLTQRWIKRGKTPIYGWISPKTSDLATA